MIHLFLAVVVVLAVPAQDYHLARMDVVPTGKPLIMSAVRCINDGGYAEVHGSGLAADPSAFVQVWCYMPDPPIPIDTNQLIVEKAPDGNQ